MHINAGVPGREAAGRGPEQQGPGQEALHREAHQNRRGGQEANEED